MKMLRFPQPFKRITVGLCAFAWPVLATRASIPVSGIVNGDTWTAANSPYLVNADVTVVQLVIQPGVTIQVNGNFQVAVTGLLRAIGTSAAPIVFKPGPGGNTWQELCFVSADPKIQEYAN